MKFASHILLFGQDKWIMSCIENSYKHVEKIYIAHSSKPWAYNPNARSIYTDNFDLNIIRNSKYADKIEIIEGIWDTEEAQRNACVNAAARDGFDFLIVHDADEFYHDDEFERIKNEIVNNPTHDVYKVGWYCFWKSFDYVLVDGNENMLIGYPEFCINLRNNVSFIRKRIPSKMNEFFINPSVGVCYHGSYVLNDNDLLKKISTWGHTNEVLHGWYENVWLKWKESNVDLHPVNPQAWKKAIKFSGKLPYVINEIK